MPGSKGPAICDRKVASPPTLDAPNPAPWNASQKLTVLKRPVAARAIFIATSMASEPPVVNRTLFKSPGEICANFSARATAGSFANRRGAKES